MNRLIAAALLAAGLTACAPEAPETRPTTGAAGASAARGQACDGTFRVTNSSTRIISRIHLRDAALTNWGRDQLGQNVLTPGGTSTFQASTPGVYDMRILWADGRPSERRRITICTGTPITVGNFGINAP